jgi:hypothetical protein
MEQNPERCEWLAKGNLVFVVKQTMMNPATHAEPQLQRSVQGLAHVCNLAAAQGDTLTPSPDRARV